MPIMSLAGATDWLAGVFARAGVAPANARSVAAALIAAEADGLKGHGLSRAPTYLGMVASRKVDGAATPTATRPKPGLVLVDAADGFAYPAIDLALAELAALAPTQGVAAAAIGRSNHAGAMGHHVEALARRGLVALAFANTPGAIAPPGGRRPLLGTNPIAFACPAPGGEPIVVDLALSVVARGNVVAAKQRGESIPEGWALDVEGNPTTNPDAALAGSMVALGGAKGAALALMVEVLAVALAGATLSAEASSFLDEKGPPPRTGQLFVAFDAEGFGHGRAGATIAALARAVEAEEGTRLPGARRLALRAKAAREGVMVADDLVARYGA